MAEEALGPPASHHSCLPSLHIESRTVLSTTKQTACKWDGVWSFGCWVVRVGGWSDWIPSCINPAPRDMPASSSGCLITQSGLTVCDPIDCSPPGSSVHGILQARISE